MLHITGLLRTQVKKQDEAALLRPLRVKMLNKMLNITNEVLLDSPSDDSYHLLSSTPWPISEEEAGEARACSDPLSFASFLAFALAVSNLLMNQMPRRKKRSARCGAEQRLEERLGEAVTTVFTGMLRAQRAGEEEGRRGAHTAIGEQLARLGRPGGIMVNATKLFGEDVFTDVKVN